MKVITLLLDGLGDRTYKELNNKTPLDYAFTPNLDKIAKISQCGTLTPLSYGISLGTDLAHFLLFGYSTDEYPSRTIIDAYGEKINFDKNDILLRGSFANVKKENGYYIKDRFTPELNDSEIESLIPLLNRKCGNYNFQVIHSYDSHCFIKISGENLSSKISDSDPFYNNQYAMLVEPFETEEEFPKKIAEIVNTYLKENYEILNNHSINIYRKSKNLPLANFILTKWAGRKKEILSFEKKTGMSGLMIGKSKLLKGIAEVVKMEYKEYDNFEEGIEFALNSDKKYIHLHTKIIDTASHSKNIYNKIDAIEKIDKVIEPLIDFEGLLIVTADHSTPCSGKMIHSGESVPFMGKGEFVRVDLVDKFTEIHCAQGSVNLEAKDFINYINNCRDEGKLYHLRSGNRSINYINRFINKLR